MNEMLQPALVQSRAVVGQVLRLLGEQHREAITLIGSHAVHERTRQLQVMSTTTKDGDFAITPELLAAQPRLEEAMRDAGFQPMNPDRPGLWCRGFSERRPIDEIDLLVPEALAGSGRRSVGSVSGLHGLVAVGRTAGIELATLDRDRLELETFDGGEPVLAYVAGVAALVCAKAYKLGERIAERDRGKRDRIMPKDAGDLWRLVAISDGAEIRGTFDRHLRHVGVGSSIDQGIHWLAQLREGGELADLADDDLGVAAEDASIADDFERWFSEFFS